MQNPSDFLQSGKGMAGVSGRSVGRTSVSCFDSTVLSWMCQPEVVRNHHDKKKQTKTKPPNPPDKSFLIQELLGSIIQGFQFFT